MAITIKQDESRIMVKKVFSLEAQLDEGDFERYLSITAKWFEGEGYLTQKKQVSVWTEDNFSNPTNRINDIDKIKKDNRFKTITATAFKRYKKYCDDNLEEGETYTEEHGETQDYRIVFLQKNYLNKKIVICLNEELGEIIKALK